MTQLTTTKLQELSIFDLYKHYSALEASLPLLTDESKELVKAELEQCLALRSEKIDRLYYCWSHHEDAVERAKKEEQLLKDQKKYHENQVASIKGLLNWLRRATTEDNKIIGERYQFNFARLSQLSVEITSDINDWPDTERQKFCMIETVTTTKHSVVTSMTGEVIEESSKPVTKTEIIPNLDAIRNAYQEGQALPHGVKVQQNYSIRRKRILTARSVGSIASEYPAELLPQSDNT